MAQQSGTEDLAAYFQNPYPAYDAMRKQRLYKDELGTWFATRFEDVNLILTDRRFGKQSPPGTEGKLPVGQSQDRDRRTILNLDPPDHTRLRGLLTKAFSARRVEAMRPNVQRLVDSILNGVVNDGNMDLVSAYAFPIPATIISDMLGIPNADRNQFARLSNDIITFSSGINTDMDQATAQHKAEAAAQEFDRYLTELFALKRQTPGDDLTTALIRAEDQDGRLSEEELTQNIRLLFMAGHETTVNLISNALVALFRFPDQLQLLKAHPDLMPKAVEEFLRFDSSVQQLPRVAQEDVEIAGQRIRAGEMVFCVLGSANRDPAVYTAPDVLDVERPFTRSKSFGGGIHFCLGAQLARIETEIALNTLFARLPSLKIVNLETLSYPMNPIFRGPEKLLAEWDC